MHVYGREERMFFMKKIKKQTERKKDHCLYMKVVKLGLATTLTLGGSGGDMEWKRRSFSRNF